ncbi:eEF1A lysine and N-terminal methyltransferase homolog [Thrips palmi]|uniref:EEF1A lysine and N-terminal methyltransferase homolog n=1 Tax=Thrips palmi TaxID=161013 RepID=A0A6P8ZJY1_THRPL|nr:eEF1A lysine and N-terminal methyltransferase homolog [Thrips palmi]
MNLLPKSREEFSKTEYWNTFFKKRGNKAFEWYGEYPELCGHLHKYIKPQDSVLVVGCGNSKLSSDLYDVGYRKIINIDISGVVIKQMLQAHSQQRPDLQFVQMDVLKMEFEDSKFNVVLDKGTLDALMSDDSPESIDRIDTMFNEVERVLKVCGRWVCVSLLQDHVLRAILRFFPSRGWMVRIARCIEAEQKTAAEGESSGLPVFVIICTKMVKMPNFTPVLELHLSADGKGERFSSPEALTDGVHTIQQAALVCSRLGTTNVVKDGEICLDLMKPGTSSPRFSVYVCDKPCANEATRKFAAFVVPQGRETEWLFGTPEGRASLQTSVGYDRLAIITMHRGHTYPSLEELQEELSECILQVAPAGHNRKIPFLSAGQDVGVRTIVHKANSLISGDILIEEVEVEDEVFRRLIFLKNPNVIQSECRLKRVKSKKGPMKYVVDTTYLGCDHHVYMGVGVSLALKTAINAGNILIIGLGGGGLCTYLHSCFKQAIIEAVDIDPLTENIAKEYFGLPVNDKIKLHFEDGLKYMDTLSKTGKTFDAVLFDVDSKDSSLGMSCPPREFLESDALDSVVKLIGDQGLFILNLVCRAEGLQKEVKAMLRSKFSCIRSYKLEQDVNEVLFCSTKVQKDKDALRLEVKSAAQNFNSIVKDNKIQSRNVVDVTDLVKKLNIS